MELFSGSGRKCWSLGAGNQDPLPANRGFRAQAGCQRGRSRTQAGLGHPEATLKPPSYAETTVGQRVFPIQRPFSLGSHKPITSACWRVIYALTKGHSAHSGAHHAEGGANDASLAASECYAINLGYSPGMRRISAVPAPCSQRRLESGSPLFALEWFE